MNGRRALIVSSYTAVNDLVEFLRSRAEPIRVVGSLIEFNNHAFDDRSPRFLPGGVGFRWC